MTKLPSDYVALWAALHRIAYDTHDVASVTKPRDERTLREALEFNSRLSKAKSAILEMLRDGTAESRGRLGRKFMASVGATWKDYDWFGHDEVRSPIDKADWPDRTDSPLIDWEKGVLRTPAGEYIDIEIPPAAVKAECPPVETPAESNETTQAPAADHTPQPQRRIVTKAPPPFPTVTGGGGYTSPQRPKLIPKGYRFLLDVIKESGNEDTQRLLYEGYLEAVQRWRDGKLSTVPSDRWGNQNLWKRTQRDGHIAVDPGGPRNPVFVKEADAERSTVNPSASIEPVDSSKSRYDKWTDDAIKMRKSGHTWKEAAKTIAHKEGVDIAYVEREVRRIRQKRESGNQK